MSDKKVISEKTKNPDITEKGVKKLSWPGRMIQGLVKAENFSIVVFFIMLSIVTVLQVLFRYVFKVSAPWTDELGRYFMIWMVFIGAGWATHAENHISINVIDILIPSKKIVRFTDTLMALVMAAFSLVYLRSALIYVPQVMRSNEMTIATKMPMWIPQFCLLVGGVLIAIHSIELLIRKVRILVKGGDGIV